MERLSPLEQSLLSLFREEMEEASGPEAADSATGVQMALLRVMQRLTVSQAWAEHVALRGTEPYAPSFIVDPTTSALLTLASRLADETPPPVDGGATLESVSERLKHTRELLDRAKERAIPDYSR